MVAGGAYITVIAGGLVQLMTTAGLRVTEICRTDIIIVAIEQPGRNTGTSGTAFPKGTGIAIVTATLMGKVLATARTAGIVGAGVEVVALQGRPGKTLPGLAVVIHCASIPIVAGAVTE